MSDQTGLMLERISEATLLSVKEILTSLADIGAQIAKTGITLQSRRHIRFTLPTSSRPPCPQSAPPIDARIADMATTARRHQ